MKGFGEITRVVNPKICTKLYKISLIYYNNIISLIVYAQHTNFLNFIFCKVKKPKHRFYFFLWLLKYRGIFITETSLF